MNDSGWFKVYRSSFEHWVSDDMARYGAWIWLVGHCNYEDKAMMFNGHPRTIHVGQLLTSIRKLAGYWNWGRDRVARFLEDLVSEGMIEKESDTHCTLITIVNYGKYQGIDGNFGHQSDSDSATDKSTHNATDKAQLKNIKNVKKDKNTSMSKTQHDEVLFLYSTYCNRLPQVRKLTPARKRAVDSCLAKSSIDDIASLFRMAGESDFLCGANSNGWVASFDWLLKETNMTKVLEGNYQNRGESHARQKQYYDPAEENDILS